MKVNKTIKLYIGGKFARTESGRSFESMDKKGNYLAHLCQASRKDFRNTVDAAKAGASAWSSLTAYNRSQIIYRMAEMLQTKDDEFAELMTATTKLTPATAKKEVQKGIDALVYFAGFCDKYQQMIGAVNPVAAPYHNFTTPEPMGVTVLIDGEFNFEKLLSNIASILVGGNSLIVLIGDECPAILGPLSEVLATSDVPPGAVNLLNGDLEELVPHIAAHREVRAISVQKKGPALIKEIRTNSIENLKRVIPYESDYKSLKPILSHVEHKTVWHPIGI